MPIASAVRDIGVPAAFVGHPPGTPDLPYVAIDNVAERPQPEDGALGINPTPSPPVP